MRRSRQQLPVEEAREILRKATNGVLSLVDNCGHPYGVPMSFVFDGEDSLIFHCATEGKKIDCLKINPHACFTVVATDDIVPEELTTYYRSVIATGTIETVTSEGAKIECLRKLSEKYAPGIDCKSEIEKTLERVTVLIMNIEEITGKEAIELTLRRNKL